jgi:hypothetical protein
MERSEILAAMGGLKLFGMKAAYDEIVATAVKRQPRGRGRTSLWRNLPLIEHDPDPGERVTFDGGEVFIPERLGEAAGVSFRQRAPSAFRQPA